MASAITNHELLWKCKEFVQSDATKESLDASIKNALITANREISELGGYQPLAWLRQSYDELFTRAYASISAITQASPAVVTAESQDEDISSNTGFSTGDIAWIEGVNGMDRLNYRRFILTSASDTTLTLTQLDGNHAINSSSYDEYDSGGYVYHAGILLPASSIEPTESEQSKSAYRWTIGDVWGVSFDGIPADPIAEESHLKDPNKVRPSGRPGYFRYWRKAWTELAGVGTAFDHYVLFPPCNQRYNVTVHLKKSYPDLGDWEVGDKVYPPHPPEIHDCIWQWALAEMVSNTEKQRREVRDAERPTMMSRIEVLYAQKWVAKQEKNKRFILNFSKRMLGEKPIGRGLSA